MRVLILHGVIAAAASAASSSHGSSSLEPHCYAPPPSETFEGLCRNTSMAELEVRVIDACKAYARAPDARRLAEEGGADDILYNSSVKVCNSTLNKKGDGFTVADVEADRDDLWTTWKKEFCFDICPFIGSGKRRCDAGGDCGGGSQAACGDCPDRSGADGSCRARSRGLVVGFEEARPRPVGLGAQQTGHDVLAVHKRHHVGREGLDHARPILVQLLPRPWGAS